MEGWTHDDSAVRRRSDPHPSLAAPVRAGRRARRHDDPGPRQRRPEPARGDDPVGRTGPPRRLAAAGHRRRHGAPCARSPSSAASRRTATPCSRVHTSTPPRIAPSCTPPCGGRPGEALVVDDQDVTADVESVLDRMAVFADGVRSGAWLGATGRPITAVVNVGIGGSDLGPAMAYLALRHASDRDIAFRFVSNVDPDRHDRGAPRSRPGDDPRHRRLEDVHHARDDDECACGPRVAGVRAGRRRRQPALRGGLDQCREGRRLRHRHREHVRLLGLGRRPLLDGLRHRPEHDDRRGQRGLPRPARRLPRDGRALRDGAAGGTTCR